MSILSFALSLVTPEAIQEATMAENLKVAVLDRLDSLVEAADDAAPTHPDDPHMITHVP